MDRQRSTFKHLVPYAQLMRLDRPAGLYAFYFPYLIGLAYASSISDTFIQSFRLARESALLLVGCVILRGSTCAFNDNIDQDFDRAVLRCKNRPIARGAVSTIQGHTLTTLLAALGYGTLQIWPAECHKDMAIIFLLFLIYPFGKRFTHYPQLILGFPFAGGIVFSCHALEIDPLDNGALWPTTYLCLANVLWTMTYDTIYAHQDLKDDIQAGVKSMAVRFQHSTKRLCLLLSIAQVALLIPAGLALGFSAMYFSLSCGGTAVALLSMIGLVNLKEPASCAWWFRSNFWLVGGSMAAGLLAEYLHKHQSELFR
ncbi:4-hydroxybenzoate polyprenyltransferase-like protein [Elsinoe fawcettii]|nr:4-hydroxybenzoate polyprenyltransferase-like protein [Elsinoe fawcettii]